MEKLNSDEDLASSVIEEVKQGNTNLSQEQRRLWFLHHLDSSYPLNLVCSYDIQLTTSFNVAVFQQALFDCIQQIPLLRTVFIKVLDRPLASVLPEMSVPFDFVSIKGMDHEALSNQMCREQARAGYRSFELDKGPLFHISVFERGEGQCTLIFTASKLICDAETVNVWTNNIFEAYQALLDKRYSPTLSKQTSIHRLEQKRLADVDDNSAVNHWKVKLVDIPHIQFPETKKRPEIKDHVHGSESHVFDPDVIAKLRELSLQQNVPIDSILLTAFSILLSVYSLQDTFVVGVLVDDRAMLGSDTAQGNAENVIPLAVDTDRGKLFASWLKQIHEAVSDRRYALPFNMLVERIVETRDLSRTPVFQVAFQTEHVDRIICNTKSLMVRSKGTEHGRTPFDLTLHVSLSQTDATCRIDFNRSVFETDFIQQLLSSYAVLLQSILDNPIEIPVYDLDVLGKTERTVLSMRSQTNRVDRPESCIHELISKQALKTPDAVAAYCKDESILFVTLDERSNQVAHYLQTLGVTVEDKVAVLLSRSIDVVMSIVGILKAGCAYVPIDPSYPPDRIKSMLDDSGSSLVISDSQYATLIPESLNVVKLDEDRDKIATFPRSPCESKATPDNLAYLLYTSGSTGTPKAVMVTHRSVVNNILFKQSQWALSTQDKVLNNTSFSFDPSVWSTFWPLISGASSVIVPSTITNDSREMVNLMKSEEITLIGTVPSVITLLLDEPEITHCYKLRYILSGGEALLPQLIQKAFTCTKAQLVNFYGPTETTMDTTYTAISPEDLQRKPSIGKPIANQYVYILDDYLRPVPQGVPGEICIGGLGVARGYHNRPKLTAEKFIQDVYANQPNRHLYRTGDIGYIRPDGEIECLGRRDDQVKIRGYRIELMEVEFILGQHPRIEEVAVVVENLGDEPCLVAYIVTRDAAPLSLKSLLLWANNKSPHYMLPSKVVTLGAMPKTQNGKIDRKGLAEHDNTIQQRPTQSVAPRNALEKTVAAFFSETLGLDKVSVYDDFFEYGGTSLSLTRLASKLYQTFELSIPLHQFFKVPSVAGISEVIEVFQREGIEAVLLQKHATSLEEDAILEEAIQPHHLPLSDSQAPKHILLTGATGYLGSFLLQALIERTQAKIVCLVRAKTKAAGLSRIQKAMTDYCIWQDSYIDRIEPLCGDLGKPRLGLDDDLWHTMGNAIDVIYHNGALVNFAYPYSALRAANVLGTKEILRLACLKKLKPVHYVSTIDVLLATHTERPFVEDDTPLKHFNDIPGGYTGSKWVSEKLMNHASQRGIPVCIYRPGLIMSHTETGATQTNDYILVAFRGFVPMKIIPDYSRIFDVVPVDYVAKAIAEISVQSEIYGKFFHLFNPKPVSLLQFCDWTKTYGYRFNIVPFEEGRRRAMAVDSEHALYPLVPLIRDADAAPQRSLDPNHMNELQPELECKNALEALKNSQIECPPMSESLTHLCLQYLINIGYLPSPVDLAEGGV